MDEYIDREAAIKAIEFNKGVGCSDRCVQGIKYIPAADVVEVVRCKDCFYWGCGPDEPIWKCNMLSHGEYSVFTSDNAYCYWGRWKEA